jgi:hypothetical protein
VITRCEVDSFAAALEVMNCGGYQLALVRRAYGSLSGMLSHGDIHKALFRGILSSSNESSSQVGWYGHAGFGFVGTAPVCWPT